MMQMFLTTLYFIGVASSKILNVRDLRSFLTTSVKVPRVGVLSTANFDSIHHLVPAHTEAVIFEDTQDVVNAVVNGDIDAGLVSGIPPLHSEIYTFSSTIVSLRAMFVHDDAGSLRYAIDAAIVRALHTGADVRAASNNYPFEYVSAHTCRTNDVDRFPFQKVPDDTQWNVIASRGHVRVAALGPYNWGTDGDYTVSPPTGFWPEFYNDVEKWFLNGTGYSFERVYFSSSAQVMDALLNGTVDATEPYWTVDAFHNNRARIHLFQSSCTTIGYDSTFIVPVHKTPFVPPDTCESRCGAQSQIIGDVILTCGCDDNCMLTDSCCIDKIDQCPSTCAGSCGSESISGCFCDDQCVEHDDCCVDYIDQCVTPQLCVGHCGGESPSGCFCDDVCSDNADCCSDFTLSCPHTDLTGQ
jgi:hypothetical protein